MGVVPLAPFEPLSVEGESITLDVEGKILVLPTGDIDLLPGNNEYTKDPRIATLSELPLGGVKSTIPDYSVGTVNIISGDGVYLQDLSGTNSAKTLGAGKLKELGLLSFDTAAHSFTTKFQIANTGDNNPSVIDACDSVTPWSIIVGTATKSIDGGTLKIAGTATGTTLEVFRGVTLNLSNAKFITFDVKGSVPGGLLYCRVRSTNGSIIWNRTGVTIGTDWTRFVLPIDSPVGTSGLYPITRDTGFDKNTVTYIYIGVSGGIASGSEYTLHIDNIASDVGKDVYVETYTPDVLTDSCFKLECYTGAVYEPVWTADLRNVYKNISINETKIKLNSGMLLKDVFGPGNGIAIFPKGCSSETVIGSTGTMTYSGNSGARHRLGMMFSLPPYGSMRLKTTVYYDDLDYNFSSVPLVANPNWLQGWTFRKKCVLDHSNVLDDLENFPLYIPITNDADMGVLQSNGSDLRITGSDGTTVLEYEIVNFSIVDGICNADIWVKIPTISASIDTVLYIYFGNHKASDAQNKAEMWSDYESVWHLTQNPGDASPQMTDSSVNGNDGAAINMTMSNMADGPCGGAISFNGLDTYINTGTGSSVDTTRSTIQLNNSTYDIGGNLINIDSNTLMFISREGNAHATGRGRLFSQMYNLTTKAWGVRNYIYTDSDETIDSRNPASGIIGNHIYVFFVRYLPTTSEFQDFGYIKSTDLTGTSWSEYIVLNISPITAVYSPQGSVISTDDPDTFLVPLYGWTDNLSAVYATGFLKTVDSGQTWGMGLIYNGMVNYNETAIEHIGSGKLVAVSRKEAGGHLWQSVSADRGVSWSPMAETNLGNSGNINVTPYLLCDEETSDLLCIFADRDDSGIKISKTNALEVYNDPTTWNTTVTVGAAFLGSPSIVKISSNNYYFVFDREINSSSTIIYGGYYPPDPHTEFMIRGWLYLNSYTPTSSNPDKSMIIIKPDAYSLCVDSTNHKMGVVLAPYLSSFVYSNSEIPLTTWTRIAISYDGTNVYWWINGQLDKTYNVTGLNFVSEYAAHIGALGGYGRHINGLLAGLQVSFVCPSAADMLADYTNQNSPDEFSSIYVTEVMQTNHLGATSYDFADSTSASYGLQNVIYPWIALYDPATSKIDFYLFTHRPKNLQFSKNELGIIHELKLFPGNGVIYHGQITYPDLTLDSDSDYIPNFLEAEIEGSITKFLKSYGMVTQ